MVDRGNRSMSLYKKPLLGFLMAVVVLICLFTLPKEAQAASVNDLTFILNADGESYSVADCNESASGEMIIPATYKDLPVTAIGKDAFRDCSDLTLVTIPNSVTIIGESAFNGCFGLMSISIPDGVTTIDRWAFTGCYVLENITIPDSVTTIGYDAFALCYNLRSITIPSSVTAIGNSAFSCCHKLTGIWVNEENINYSSDSSGVLFNKDRTTLLQAPGTLSRYTIPDSVTTIEKYAFQGCVNLVSVSIPDCVDTIGNGVFEYCSQLSCVTIGEGITEISSSMFYGCSSLSYITIPDSVTVICGKAFAWCEGLNTVAIPDSVRTIDDEAFDGCYNLDSVIYCGTQEQWRTMCICDSNENLTDALVQYHNYENDICTVCGFTPWEYIIADRKVTVTGYAGSETNLIIPDTIKNLPVTGIGEDAFSDCTDITSVTIPNNVITIGKGAFDGCSSLASVTIPGSVTTIGESVFRHCSSLTSFSIPDGITIIDKWAFTGCENLTSITIPDSVTTIGYDAFGFCTSLTTVTIPKNVTTIDYAAFSGCFNLTGIWVDENNANYSNDNYGVLFNKDKTTLMQAPGALSGGYTIPNSVTNIGEYAFNGCFSLTSVFIPGTVATIGDSVFEWCPNLTSATIGDGITEIGFAMFYNCPRLSSITIPNSVTSIGHNAFFECSSLRSITIPDSVISIGDYAFTACTGLTSIAIPCSVTTIGYAAFADCEGLVSIAIPENVTTIDYTAFSGCFNLTGIWVDGKNANYSNDSYGVLFDKNKKTLIQAPGALSGSYFIPNSVITIGDSAFISCDALTAVIISDNVVAIGDSAFFSCDGLVSVTISDSVAAIGSDAFNYCRNLTSVIIGNGVKTIGYNAFSECMALTDVYYTGSENQWTNIQIEDSGNSYLLDATIHYNFAPETYTIVFKNWNGNVISTMTYNWNDEITVPANPVRESDNTYRYTFAGWDKEIVACAGDATYTATYTSTYIDYRVIFKDWNGTVLSSKIYHWGNPVTEPTNPSRPYDENYIYTFAGWDKAVVSCSGDAVYTATYNKTAIMVTSIAITTKPTKLIYVEGDTFDKTGMVVTAYYNNNTSNAVADYTISGYTSTVGTKTITVSYEGNTAAFTVTVNSKVPSAVTSSTYTVSGSSVSKIAVGTTVKSLLSGLNEGSCCKVYNGTKEVTVNTTVGTGMVVKIMDGNTAKASYTIVVTGDTNGDGKISVTDMLAAKAYLLKKSTLQGAAAQAADTNGDNGISITDFIQMKAHILGKSTVEPRNAAPASAHQQSTVFPGFATQSVPNTTEATIVTTACTVAYAQLPEKKTLVGV